MPINAIPNRFREFNTMTYGISLYLQSHTQYNKMMETGAKDVTGLELLIQSGGANLEAGRSGNTELGPALEASGNYGAKRNKFFDKDFYLDDIQLQSYIAGTATGGPQNTFEAAFTVTEPMGLTFMERLYNASVTHAKENDIENFNPVNQIYLMVIRFYGYDENGKQIMNAQFDGASDPGSYIEKWIPIMIRQIQFKIEDTKVVYSCECVCPQTQAGHGQIHGTIPFDMGLQGATLTDLLVGETRTQSSGGVVTQGLVAALNHHQLTLESQGKYERADEYNIEFQEGVGLDNAVMAALGTSVVARGATGAGMSTGTTIKKSVGPAQVANKEVKTQATNAGMKIVKFIDLAIRSSRYMTNQYRKINDANKDDSTNPVGGPDKPLNWFKIRPRVEILGFDKKRQGWAYKITYVITVYPVASVQTDDFQNAGRCINIHKEYNHWFTGLNTEVLRFTQEYNTFYFTTFSAKHMIDPSQNPKYQNNFRAQRVYRPTSSEAHTGENLEDEQAANAASILYAPQDIANCEIDIVGDPDWLGQSELFYKAVRKPDGAILKDGSLNYDRAEVYFSVNFNTVVDYNLQSGLADVTQQNVGKDLDGRNPSGVSQYAFVYRANTITSQFEKGKFTQKLKGTLMYIPEACVKDLVDISGLSKEDLGTIESSIVSSDKTLQIGDALGDSGASGGGLKNASDFVKPGKGIKDWGAVSDTQQPTDDQLRPDSFLDPVKLTPPKAGF